MNRGSQPWRSFADASRAAGGESPDELGQPQPIPWLSEFPEQVHAVFLQLIWKRWATATILAALLVLTALLLSQRPSGTADATPPAPRITIPVAP